MHLKNSQKTYVLDTNIILDDVNNIFKLYNNENTIVIPETVVDELDNKKSLLDEVGYQAREFARLLDKLEVKSAERKTGYTATILKNDKLEVKIVSKHSYNFSNESSSIINDRKIIEVAKLFNNCIFVSLDGMCRIRAISEGVTAVSLGVNEENKKFNPVFYTEFTDDFKCFGNKIEEIDNSDAYSFLVTDEKNNKKIGRINSQNNILLAVDEENLKKQDIKPLNTKQKFFVDAMLDDVVKLIILDAPAGTGKTLLAVSTALRLVKEKKFSKIIYIRNSIESLDKGEDVGYLAGNDEKFAIYNHPLYDSLEFIARKQLESSNKNKSNKIEIDNIKIKEKIQEIIEKSNIETMWVGEMRGRTISNAFVIMDETQNFSRKSALLVLSRLDKDCKIVTIGSNKQIDNLYINKYNNALAILKMAACDPVHKKSICIWAGSLTNVVRGPLTEFAEAIFV